MPETKTLISKNVYSDFKLKKGIVNINTYEKKKISLADADLFSCIPKIINIFMFGKFCLDFMPNIFLIFKSLL